MKLSFNFLLPTPNSTYRTKEVTFNVYRAKDLYTKEWRYPILKKFVSIARTSYHRYGARDLFDRYDEKAAIYLVHAEYKSGRHVLGEWLSVRMVPGDGAFKGVGELELYRLNNVKISELLLQKRNYSRKSFWQHIISDSRLCGIHPYRKSGAGKVHPITKKHLYSAESMALMQVQFMIDYPPEYMSFHYVTAIVRPEIKNKVITFHKNKKILKPIFFSAHRTLDLPKNTLIVVSRKKYTYQFPMYWLDMPKLKSLLLILLKKGQLTQKTFTHYLKGYSLETSEGEIMLAKMLTAKGKLIGSSITGTQLRKLIDKVVPDAPELQITPIDLWRKGFLRILNNSGINFLKKYPDLNRFLR